MRIVVNIDSTAAGSPRAVATIARGFLKGVILQNRIYIRRGLVPKSLYREFMAGRLLFQPEPNAGKWEDFADALTVCRRGWGDCDDLVPWRCAELQERGINAQPKVYWRIDDEGNIHYHTEVRRPCVACGSLRCEGSPDGGGACACCSCSHCDGALVEDVSAYLGMTRRRRTARAA